MNNQFDYYALTIRKCSNVKTYKQSERVLNDYDYYLNQLKKNTGINHIDIHYEVKMNMKKHFNIHVHCTLTVDFDADIYCKPKKGFSIRLERVKSLTRWKSYIGKQKICKADILLFVKCNLGHPSIVPQVDSEVHIMKEPYIPNSEDLSAFEEFIRDAPNYQVHIKE